MYKSWYCSSQYGDDNADDDDEDDDATFNCCRHLFIQYINYKIVGIIFVCTTCDWHIFNMGKMAGFGHVCYELRYE